MTTPKLEIVIPAGAGGDGDYALSITPERAGWALQQPQGPGAGRRRHAHLRHRRGRVGGPAAVRVVHGGRVTARRSPSPDAAASSPASPTSPTCPATPHATVTSQDGGRFALCGARAQRRLTARYGPAEGVQVELRGAGQASRQVNNFCTPATFEADKLIAVEVITPGGNWSSFPPHKHDEAGPDESCLEEVYYFEADSSYPAGQAGACGYQRVYGSGPGKEIDVLRRGAHRRRDPHPLRLARPGDGRARLRPLLPERHGRPGPRAGLEDLRRPGARLGPHPLGRPGDRRPPAADQHCSRIPQRRRRRSVEDHHALDRRQAGRRVHGPHEPGLEPGHGRAAGRGGAGERRRRRRRRPHGEGRVRAVGPVVAVAAHQGPVQVPRAGQRQHPAARRGDLRRARQGRLRRPRRGAARPRGDRVRLRHPDPAQGRLLRPGLDRRRRLLVPPAARGVRRHHAVQLPGHGADVDVPGGDRDRQHLRAQAERARPQRLDADRRAVGRGRPARRRVQRRARRQDRGRRPARRTRTSRRCRSSARRRSPSTSTRRARRAASASRPSAAPRTTRSSCPTPASTTPATTSSPPPSARPASGAWRSRPPWRSGRRRATT